EGGAFQARHPFRQVPQIVLEFGESIGDFGGRATGDSDSARFDVHQGSNAVHLRLNDPGVMIVLDGVCLGLVEILPGSEKHRHDLVRERLVWMILPPVMIPKGGDVWLLACTSLRFNRKSENGTFGLKFGQVLHGRFLEVHRSVTSSTRYSTQFTWTTTTRT